MERRSSSFPSEPSERILLAMEGVGSSSSFCCLEVDVNGQETFMVDLKVVTSFSRRLARLFGAKSMRRTGKVKVVFRDFPGGPEGFELMSVFCYNNGSVLITLHHVVLLNCVAHFMEMDDEISCSMSPSLVHQTEKSLGGVSYWSWSELLSALKQCQELLTGADSSFVARKIMESIIERLGLPDIAMSCTSSSDSSSYRFSTDTRSTESRKTEGLGSRSWWFGDLVFLKIDWMARVVKLMLSQEFDHAMITRFLVYYQKSRSAGATPVEKQQMIESIIDMLSLLDRSSLPWKCLFEVFRAGSGPNIGMSHRVLLERLMGSRLDQATLDHLLLPSPSYAYDLDWVIRIARTFLKERSSTSSPDRLKKVGQLVDSFLVEVAPDISLNPLKYESLVTVLPETARESHNLLYQSIDLYLEVHDYQSEEQKLQICLAMNYEKLSSDALNHFAKNTKFPPNFRANAMPLVMESSHRSTRGRREERATAARLQRLQPMIHELERLYRIIVIKPQKMSCECSDHSYLPKLCSS